MSANSSPEIKALVVCLGTIPSSVHKDEIYEYTGNICRSPMGEAVLKDIATKRGIDIEVDSCGTGGYHVGEEPDERCARICFIVIQLAPNFLKDS